jgi:hypothetical protein
MTNSYLIRAWCDRPFITYLDQVEAETPEEAIAIARRQPAKLLDAAEECNSKYPWHEFAAYDENGNELLHVLDDDGRLRDAAPALLAALTACTNYIADDLDESDETELRIFRQARAAIVKAAAVPASGASHRRPARG